MCGSNVEKILRPLLCKHPYRMDSRRWSARWSTPAGVLGQMSSRELISQFQAFESAVKCQIFVASGEGRIVMVVAMLFVATHSLPNVIPSS
jgi:hypothetical protein